MADPKLSFVKKHILIILIVLSAGYIIPASYRQSRQPNTVDTRKLPSGIAEDYTGNWMCIIPFAIGFTLFFVLLYCCFRKMVRLKMMHLADGRVTGFGSIRPNGGGRKLTGRAMNLVHAPTIEFVVKGKTYQFQDPNYGFIRRYQVGQTVTVYYDPKDPSHAPELKSIFQWLSACGGLLIACAFMIPILQYFGVKW